MAKKKKKDPLNQVVVFLEFDRRLQDLTGASREKVILSEGTPFIMFLQAILESYSTIMTRYSLGSIAFSINGLAPTAETTLSANDIVTMQIADQDSSYFDVHMDEYRH